MAELRWVKVSRSFVFGFFPVHLPSIETGPSHILMFASSCSSCLLFDRLGNFRCLVPLPMHASFAQLWQERGDYCEVGDDPFPIRIIEGPLVSAV